MVKSISPSGIPHTYGYTTLFATKKTHTFTYTEQEGNSHLLYDFWMQWKREIVISREGCQPKDQFEGDI